MEKINVDDKKLIELYHVKKKSIRECAILMNTTIGPIYRRLRELDILRKRWEHFKGRKQTKEHIAKRLKTRASMNYIVSEETRRKISKGHKGKILSEETKRKISVYNKGRHSGANSPFWQGGISFIYNPVKEKAHNIIRYLKRTGKLKNQACEICGEYPGRAHHDDYTKPLEIRWLCVKHHRAFHREHIMKDYKYIPLREAD